MLQPILTKVAQKEELNIDLVTGAWRGRRTGVLPRRADARLRVGLAVDTENLEDIAQKYQVRVAISARRDLVQHKPC